MSENSKIEWTDHTDRWEEGRRVIRDVTKALQSTLEPEVIPAAREIPRTKQAKVVEI
jgi:hypothetical protein